MPDGAAQSLSRRRKNVIGLVCVERQSPRQQYDIESMSLLFYDEVLRGVEARIREHNWSLLITYLEEAADPDLSRLLSLSGKVDGLLIGEGIVASGRPGPAGRTAAGRGHRRAARPSGRPMSSPLTTGPARPHWSRHLIEDHG